MSNQQPIPYGKQNITDEDISSVVSALKADYLTQGPRILEFEKAFADYVDADYAIAVSNGTAALHLNALALGVKPGDKVITTPITFAATANCISYCGAEVIFCDIEPKSYLLDITKVREKLEADDSIKGIIPVDFAGRAVNLEEFRALADEFGCWLMEDSCHAPGGYFNDSDGELQRCGNGKFADVAIFSFHPVKHIAAGEGGMITTNNKALYEDLLSLRTHGIVKSDDLYVNSPSFASAEENSLSYPMWYMEMQTLGYNYRITDFQAALGKSQLTRANQNLTIRRQIAEIYWEAFQNEPYIVSQSGVIAGHAYHLYVLEVKDRLGLYNYLRENQIYAQIHYIPCHLMPFYRRMGWKDGDLPVAEEYYRNCISLPMYPTLSAAQQGRVINTVKSYYG